MDEKIFEKERNSVKLTIYSGCSPFKTQDGSQAVLAEIFCQKSPILLQFIAKIARYLAQNRGKFASFYPYLMV